MRLSLELLILTILSIYSIAYKKQKSYR